MEYMSPWIEGYNMQIAAGGYLKSPDATSDCQFCTYEDTNAFLYSLAMNPDDAYRNLCLMSAYIAFNVAAAMFFYWLVRVPKRKAKKQVEAA